ncbi:MAG: radical SAM protein [Deltaproteobacteria bacterium]|nr:radical SAM protein [Deltaproteobacteria bacterium]
MNSTIKLATRLFINGFRFQYLKTRGLPGRPQAVSLEITHNCVAKCIMCNIWKIPREVRDLSVEQWIRLLSSDLLSDLRELDITGGEPFLRDDLPRFFSGICSLKEKHLRSLQSIAVTTNGFLTGRVLDCVSEILPGLRAAGLDLVMVCAMDAIGDIHESIRNYPDAWSKVNRTIQGLKGLREKFPNLLIGLKTTILPMNVGELKGIVRYAEENGLFTIISPCIITDGRYLNPDRADDLIFREKDVREMIEFYGGGTFRWSIHGRTVLGYLRDGVTKKPCSCGFNYFFVRSTGELFLCPLINIGMGNILHAPVENLFTSREAFRFRRNVGRFPECRRCTEPGLERYALPYQGFSYLSILLTKGKQEFLELHGHMGLDKYLP